MRNFEKKGEVEVFWHHDVVPSPIPNILKVKLVWHVSCVKGDVVVVGLIIVVSWEIKIFKIRAKISYFF
jgi:hypothetical protein